MAKPASFDRLQPGHQCLDFPDGNVQMLKAVATTFDQNQPGLALEIDDTLLKGNQLVTLLVQHHALRRFAQPPVVALGLQIAFFHHAALAGV